jgi:hypothetical protein
MYFSGVVSMVVNYYLRYTIYLWGFLLILLPYLNALPPVMHEKATGKNPGK